MLRASKKVIEFTEEFSKLMVNSEVDIVRNLSEDSILIRHSSKNYVLTKKDSGTSSIAKLSLFGVLTPLDAGENPVEVINFWKEFLDLCNNYKVKITSKRDDSDNIQVSIDGEIFLLVWLRDVNIYMPIQDEIYKKESNMGYADQSNFIANSIAQAVESEKLIKGYINLIASYMNACEMSGLCDMLEVEGNAELFIKELKTKIMEKDSFYRTQYK